MAALEAERPSAALAVRGSTWDPRLSDIHVGRFYAWLREAS